MLKAIVLTALMKSVEQQQRAPTQAEIEAVERFNAELESAEAGSLLDRDVDEVFEELLAAIETFGSTGEEL
jgi:formate dehydrogenase maturation protein FdhE